MKQQTKKESKRDKHIKLIVWIFYRDIVFLWELVSFVLAFVYGTANKTCQKILAVKYSFDSMKNSNIHFEKKRSIYILYFVSFGE